MKAAEAKRKQEEEEMKAAATAEAKRKREKEEMKAAAAAEAKRKREEEEMKAAAAAEVKRKREEEEMKAAEAKRKQEEEEMKAAEAERNKNGIYICKWCDFDPHEIVYEHINKCSSGTMTGLEWNRNLCGWEAQLNCMIGNYYNLTDEGK